MTEEEKAALAAKQKEEFEANLEDLSEEEKAQKIAEEEALSKHNSEIEEALKVERERREKAERELEETRRKAKERWEEKHKQGENLEDNPLTKKELEEMLSERDEKIRKETQESRAFEEARKLVESDAEANLVIEIWKNRKLAGTFQEQIQEAHSIVLGKRLMKENEELKRTLASEEGLNTENLNFQRKPFPPSAPKLGDADKSVVKGMTWDSSKKAYKKSIAGGRKIFYVSGDLKKRWTEDAK